jgi:hypothetical protein
MAKTPEKPQRRPGRPSREDEVRRTLAEIGVDPTAIDPLRILASIAINRSMPPTARVAACKVLLGVRDQEDDGDGGDAARINERAIARMRAN